jgi:predicted transcriptional regulator
MCTRSSGFAAFPGRAGLRYRLQMQAVASKQRILNALDDLPEDASVEDAIERLYFLAKVEKGFAELDAGQSLDHDEVKRRVGL